MAKLKDVAVGQRFGNLVLLRRIPDDTGHGVVCMFRCDCGVEKREYLSKVRLGKCVSCGCVKQKIDWEQAQKLKDNGYSPAQIQRELGGNLDYIRAKLFAKPEEEPVQVKTDSSLEIERRKVKRFVDTTPGQLQSHAVEFLCTVLRSQRERVIAAIDELVKERVIRRSPVDRLYRR